MTKSKVAHWNIPVPKNLDEALEKAISLDMHRTKTEYIRDAVRRMLEAQGLYPQKLEDEPATDNGSQTQTQGGST